MLPTPGNREEKHALPISLTTGRVGLNTEVELEHSCGDSGFENAYGAHKARQLVSDDKERLHYLARFLGSQSQPQLGGEASMLQDPLDCYTAPVHLVQYPSLDPGEGSCADVECVPNQDISKDWIG